MLSVVAIIKFCFFVIYSSLMKGSKYLLLEHLLLVFFVFFYVLAELTERNSFACLLRGIAKKH